MVRKILNINIPEDKLKNEFNTITKGKENGYVTGSYWNNIILYFQWREFYKKELELWNANAICRGLPLQSYIYLNRLKYIKKGYLQLSDREILRAFKISGIYVGNSFHSPFWIKQFIKDYNIKSIYDCCGGWGHRLLGAMDIKYIYNDINPVTNINCRKICDYFKLKDKYFYCEDSAYFTPQEDYEAVFTCPPYYNTEIYSDIGAENKPYDDFLDWWKQTIIKSCIKKDTCKYFAFIINQTYKEDLVKICLDLKLNKLKEIPLGVIKYSHLNFNKQHKLEKREYLYILQKN